MTLLKKLYRYHLYVDCMPSGPSTSTLVSSSLNKMVAIARSNETLNRQRYSCVDCFNIIFMILTIVLITALTH